MGKKVFLGGTCNGSAWRENLIPLLEIDYFNPVVSVWDDKAAQREIAERESCDFCLYVLTPLMEGFFAVAEVVEDSNKRPEKTVLLVLPSDEGRVFSSHQLKSLDKVKAMVAANGATVLPTLQDVAAWLNQRGS